MNQRYDPYLDTIEIAKKIVNDIQLGAGPYSYDERGFSDNDKGYLVGGKVPPYYDKLANSDPIDLAEWIGHLPSYIEPYYLVVSRVGDGFWVVQTDSLFDKDQAIAHAHDRGELSIFDCATRKFVEV